MRHLGLSRTKAYEFTENCYFGFYFIGRVIIGTVLIWNIMICDEIFLPLKIVGFPLELRSLYFVYQMYMRVVEREKYDLAIAKEGIELAWLTPPNKE